MINSRSSNSLGIIKFAIPIMLQGLVTCSINFVDSLMVGALGEFAVGGVAAVNRFYAIMSSASNSVVTSSGIYISQFFGANETGKIKESYRSGILLTTLITIPFFITALLIPEGIVSFFNNDVNIVSLGKEYLEISKYSYFALGLSLMMSNALYSTGKVTIPLYVSGITVMLKGLLNYILMYGHLGFPALGVVGAAISTLTVRIVELCIYLLVVLTHKYVFITRLVDLFKISKEILRKIVFTAIPFSINNMLWSAGNSMILKIYGSRGPRFYNAYAITGTIVDIFNNLNGSFGSAISILVAQRLGEDNLKEARKFAYGTYKCALYVSVVLCVIMYISSYLISMLYSGVSKDIIMIATNLLRLQAACYFVYQIGMQGYFIFKAGGDTKSIMIMDCFITWIVQIPLLALAASMANLDIYSLLLVHQAGELLKLIVSLILLRRERWLINLAK